MAFFRGKSRQWLSNDVSVLLEFHGGIKLKLLGRKALRIEVNKSTFEKFCHQPYDFMHQETAKLAVLYTRRLGKLDMMCRRRFRFI